MTHIQKVQGRVGTRYVRAPLRRPGPQHHEMVMCERLSVPILHVATTHPMRAAPAAS